jgi:chromosome segregation ATPase
MRSKKFVVGIVAVMLLAMTAGCAKPPQAELDASKAALADAEKSEAAKYAAEAWDKAQQAQNAVNAEIEAQNNKFALFRSYTKAKELTATATQAANDAKAAAIAGKEAAKAAAQAAIDAAKAAITGAQDQLKALDACKRKPKDFKKDLEAMKGNLDGLAAQVAGIESAFTSEDYMGAKSQAESLKGQVDTLATDMTNAKAKIKC